MDLAETRPRTVLTAGAIGGVLLGGMLAAITPTSMIHAPDPPWRLSLPAQVGETAWVATASAPEDPMPRFADAYAYTAAGWSFPPALRTEWRETQLQPYPVAAYEERAEPEPMSPAEAPAEVEATAREAAQTAATAAARADAPTAEPAPPSEDQLVPVDIDA